MNQAKQRRNRTCNHCEEVFISTARELKRHAKYCVAEPELTSEPLSTEQDSSEPSKDESALEAIFERL